jgi:hypothetical protein
MTVRSVFAGLYEWIFRSAALRDARAAVHSPKGDRGRAAQQARLLVEVAHRVADPVEKLPPGSDNAVVLSIYRDAVYWALAAAGSGHGAPAGDLAAAWADVPSEALRAVAPDPAALEGVKNTLVTTSPARLDVSDEELARVRAFADALVAEMDAPRRRAERVLGQRWTRIALATIVLVFLGMGVRTLALGRNLAADRPFRTSSAWSGCAGDPFCVGLLFCSDPSDNNPWIEFDLGSPKRVRRVDVTNRGDCCQDRAVPLIVEVSNDRSTWTEVAKHDKEFQSWTAKFPPRNAKYVRLRVPRQTVFHLQDVAIR